VLLVSGNTMAMSVRERVREVGVLKTLGFTREAILGMILGEAVLLALLGGVIGLVIASGLCAMMRQAPAFISQLKTLSIQPAVGAVCLAVAAAIGLISSFLPAWAASSTPIVEALRRND
jgi:putative ABC transport system permease protein